MNSLTVELWQGEVAATETDYSYYWQILDQAEQQHAGTFRNENLRNHYVETRARLRMVLGTYLNVIPVQLRIGKAEHGKPYLLDFPDVAFNLSHTGNHIMVAVTHHCLLGVDIEVCKPRINLPALVDKCFAEEEKHYWEQLPETQQVRGFYQFWTRKEAFVKATGRGLALGLKQCVINPEKPTTLLRIPENYGQVTEWLINDIELSETICGALVVKSKNTNSSQLNINLNSLSTE